LVRVYDEFYRLEGDHREHQQGLGLGLSIIKRLAGILDHPYQLSSMLGRGTVFSITVPQARLERDEGATRSLPPGDLAGRRILIIEDDPAIVASMCELLSTWDCTVITASSMDTAVSQVQAGNNLPDLIVSDYHLQSGCDGIEVIQKLRDMVGADLPALIVTGDTSQACFQQAQEHGLPLLHKPLAAARLRSIISFLTRRSPSAAIS
jgi:CheY-like chemotaxis protein